MRLQPNLTMATAVEHLPIDPQSRFLEMKSLQPYSTTDEYLYAMKEDLADWLSNMYADWRPITVDNFLECLENGVLLCYHANNVNEAARKICSLTLINCKYRSNARPQTFNARDNVSQFIKWARRVAGVREVLMFESDDLILRKNEKNFLLCLLEIARYGAKFGVSVPAIIKLEDEIEREIERDKQTEILSFVQLKRLQGEEEEKEDRPRVNDDSCKTFTSSTSNDTNRLQKPSVQIWNNRTERIEDSEDNYDRTTSSDVPTTTVPSNEEPQFSRTVVHEEFPVETHMNGTLVDGGLPLELQMDRLCEHRDQPIVPPASSSYLHKTVVQIVNSCCCSQRFPVIRIGEGKYRIGENGTIIFIRILRNHVMVRVGGGWDTLENYLNKHDPCRRSGGHRRSEHDHHHHHSNVPILAIPNSNISPSVQKNTPFGKSITIKTEEFPLAKPTNHDTNLSDAQLVITRGADGRHRIGQITYKSEEDTLNQPSACPHHHQTQSSTMTRVKTPRTTGRSTPSTVYTKQSSPSTDQDYSSLTETIPSKPSSSSSLDFKEELLDQPMSSLNLTTNHVRIPSPVNLNGTHSIAESIEASHSTSYILPEMKRGITESVIDSIDGYIHPTLLGVERDFDVHDIDDVIGNPSKTNLEKTSTNMDDDSLESSEGVLEEKIKPITPSLPPATKKSPGYTSAFYLAQKHKFQQEKAANRKRPVTALHRYTTRSNTLPNVAEAVKTEEESNKSRRKVLPSSQRSQSSELVEKINDISKLDRDSGFDEQDFRRERLHSNGDDNSSVSSVRSARSSTARSVTLEYKENKSYELRMKKLEAKRNVTPIDSSVKTRRPSSSTSRRGSDMIPPIAPTSRYRKNSQPNATLKQTQLQDESVFL